MPITESKAQTSPPHTCVIRASIPRKKQQYLLISRHIFSTKAQQLKCKKRNKGITLATHHLQLPTWLHSLRYQTSCATGPLECKAQRGKCNFSATYSIKMISSVAFHSDQLVLISSTPKLVPFICKPVQLGGKALVCPRPKAEEGAGSTCRRGTYGQFLKYFFPLFPKTVFFFPLLLV